LRSTCIHNAPPSRPTVSGDYLSARTGITLSRGNIGLRLLDASILFRVVFKPIAEKLIICAAAAALPADAGASPWMWLRPFLDANLMMPLVASSSKKREFTTNTNTFNSYIFVTGHPHLPDYWKAMRYFFHIFDGPKVFPDEDGNRLSSPELAIRQAKALAVELSKAGEFCRSNLVFVLDENGNNIFGCRAV
jgi:hypothetical protein